VQYNTTYDSFGLKSSSSTCNGTADGTQSGSWTSCVENAYKNNYYRLAWVAGDASTEGTCKFYTYSECKGLTETNGTYLYGFVGPAPAFAPTISPLSELIMLLDRLDHRQTQNG